MQVASGSGRGLSGADEDGGDDWDGNGHDDEGNAHRVGHVPIEGCEDECLPSTEEERFERQKDEAKERCEDDRASWRKKPTQFYKDRMQISWEYLEECTRLWREARPLEVHAKTCRNLNCC